MADPIRVILVDDHEIVRRGIREILEEEPDIDVIAEAANATDGYTCIVEQNPDVVVLDIKLPGESGIGLAYRLRENAITGGILILSAFDDDPYIEAAVRAGVNGYVMKSAGGDFIVESVREVFEGKQVFDAVREQVKNLHPAHSETTRTPQTQLEDPLTQRETEILKLAARGLTNKAIAYDLSISDRTVQTHLKNIYRKLDVSGRTEMTLQAISLGLIAQDDVR